MIEKKAEELAWFLKSIAHPLRIKMLCLMADGERTVGELQSVLKTTTANISQHLSVLRQQGIIGRRKDANYIYNRIADQRVIQLMETLKNLYC